eukprot:Pgem_evm1s16534
MGNLQTDSVFPPSKLATKPSRPKEKKVPEPLKDKKASQFINNDKQEILKIKTF